MGYAVHSGFACDTVIRRRHADTAVLSFRSRSCSRRINSALATFRRSLGRPLIRLHGCYPVAISTHRLSEGGVCVGSVLIAMHGRTVVLRMTSDHRPWVDPHRNPITSTTP